MIRISFQMDETVFRLCCLTYKRHRSFYDTVAAGVLVSEYSLWRSDMRRLRENVEKLPIEEQGGFIHNFRNEYKQGVSESVRSSTAHGAEEQFHLHQEIRVMHYLLDEMNPIGRRRLMSSSAINSKRHPLCILAFFTTCYVWQRLRLGNEYNGLFQPRLGKEDDNRLTDKRESNGHF
jgi:hypothetical protein